MLKRYYFVAAILMLSGCLTVGEDALDEASIDSASYEVRGISGGGKFEGRIYVGDELADFTRTQDMWRLHISSETAIRFDLISTNDEDTFLRLYKRRAGRWRWMATNDDCDSSTYDSCLERSLTSGRYMIVATSWDWARFRDRVRIEYDLSVIDMDGSNGEEGDICGTRGAGECSSALFCDYYEESQCGANDLGGVCTTIPMACTREYRPVCGCDGNTYSNSCVAHSQGQSIDYLGACN